MRAAPRGSLACNSSTVLKLRRYVPRRRRNQHLVKGLITNDFYHLFSCLNGRKPSGHLAPSLCPGCARIKKLFSKLSASYGSPLTKAEQYQPLLVANLYAYNPLMRLFRHFFQ